MNPTTKRDLSKTMGGDLDSQIDVIIKIMWATRDDRFYFESYGKDIIKTLVKDWDNILGKLEGYKLME